jgi:hypothetical protein
MPVLKTPGLVPNLALTVGMFIVSKAECVSGRLYRNTSRDPTPDPKSTTCSHIVSDI